MRTITKLKATIVLGVAIAGLFVVAERLYLVNGAQYPRPLATDVGAVRFEDLDGLRVGSCNGEPVEVYPKTGYWVLRCGVAYSAGHTFISHTDPFALSNYRGVSL
ncbi:hypothetical protein [Ralstonia sp. A12]|uniref:hypothetical protein n=1 Tax=Ralstonia sp. A12 TaxID=1217052 RepID=UPI00069471B9|nr:hypothetical protein [Ralstonia sp. A12]